MKKIKWKTPRIKGKLKGINQRRRQSKSAKYLWNKFWEVARQKWQVKNQRPEKEAKAWRN